MPLHLLGKKSWNVYNPTAIARVRADEAAAAAREAAHEQLLDEHDARKRLALLRGQQPSPSPPPLEPAPTDSGRRADNTGEKRQRDEAAQERRKRRKLAGEDDTDRDIRVARQREEERVARRDAGPNGGAGRSGVLVVEESESLVDEAGHIQLFAPPSVSQVRKGKEQEMRKGRAGKEKGVDEGGQGQQEAGGMRFADAAGFRNAPGHTPWYAARREVGYSGTEEVEQAGEKSEFGGLGSGAGTDAFGNEDAGRGRRDAARMAAADPMAAMARAQTRLKAVERSREDARRERERELAELKEMQRREEKREARRRREKSSRRNDDRAEKHGKEKTRHSSERHGHGRHHERDWDGEAKQRRRRRSRETHRN